MFRRNRSIAARTTNRIDARSRFNRLALQHLENRLAPATIVVTNNLDDINVDGTISIREAIASINGAANINADVTASGYGTADTVDLTGLTGTINLTAANGAQLTLSKAMTITGPGAGVLSITNTAAASTTSRIFLDNNPTSGAAGLITISGLTLTGGNVSGTGSASFGGGIHISTNTNMTLNNVTVTGNTTTAEGGGISNYSTGVLTLNNSTVSNNKCTGGDGGGINNQATSSQVVVNNSTISGNSASSDGGGIYMNNSSTLTLSGTTISGNTAAATSGGIYFFGSSGVWTINNSTITLNKANGGNGGGIRLNSGVMTMTNSQVTQNTASASGGGISNQGGTFNIHGSTIDSNSATTSGGGISQSSGTLNLTAPLGTPGSTISNNTSTLGGGLNLSGGTVTIRNSTIAKNTATGTTGGGGFNLAGATVNLQNTTVAINAATGAGAVGGGFRRTSGTLNLSSALIANNSSTAGGADGHSTVAAGVTVTLNNSLIGTDIAGDNITYTGTGQTNVAAGLDPAGLQLNGAAAGTPLTIALQPGSLALDAGNNAQSLTRDQRGGTFGRTEGVGTDVGAFELPSIIPSASGGPFATISTVSPDYTFTVTYKDNDSNIDLTSLDNNDITVSGSPAFAVPVNATFVSSTAASKSVTATYKITPTDNSFDIADNGTYTISVNAGQVFDTDGTPNSVPATNVGTFKVAIPQTFVVNATNDETVDTDTKTSLREALALANADTLTADSITFDGTVFASLQTITLATGLGELKVSAAVTITGPGAGVVVDAAALSRVLNVDAPALTAQPVSISNMTFTNGKLTSGNGAGILNNDEALSLANVTVQNSTTTGEGGGINVALAVGSLNLTNCIVTNNTATSSTSNGGGIDIRAASAVSISTSTVSANSSGEDGGGIYFFSGGTLSMTNSTVSGNKSNTVTSTNYGGGGVYFFAVTANILQSTISGNSTNSAGKDSNGGGISALSSTNLTVRNSTIALNNAGTKAGGGIHNGGTATITLDSTIVSDNSATTGKDVNGAVTANFSLISSTAGATITGGTNVLNVSAGLQPLALNGGTTANHLPTLNVFNVGNNSQGLLLDQRGGPRTLEGVIDIGSVESIAPASTPPTGAATAPNVNVAGGTVNTITVVYTDAETNIDVSKLDNNDLQITGPGGPYGVVFKSNTPAGLSVTATYEVTAPGGTYDAADNGTYTVNIVAGEVFDTDAPPQSAAAAAIGSFKVAIAANYVVNATNDEAVDSDTKTSLREAILASNGSVGLTDSITFDATVFGTPQTIALVLALGQLSITDAVTITGPTAVATVDAAASASRIFNIDATGSGNKVSISNLILTNGNAGSGNGGGIQNNDEALSLTNVTVSNCTTTAEGGGISVAATAGSLTLTSCTISNNSATSTTSNGGGINLTSGSTVVVDKSTISGNKSGEDGGGLYFFFNGSLTVTDSTISGNIADTAAAGLGGGGVYFYGTAGTMLISNSTVSGNTANNGGTAGYGGAILLNAFTGTSVIRNSTIAFNDAGKTGGGLAQAGGSSNISSSIIAGNTVNGLPATTSDLFFIAATNVPGNDNVIGIQDAATNATFTGTGTQSGTVGTPLDAKLGALALNGAPAGTPFTHALLAGSPAIDKGNNASALATDQRGFTRSVGVTDVGSFELQAAPPTVANVQIDDGTIQRSMIRSLTVTFSGPVTITDLNNGAITLDRKTAVTGPLGLVNLNAVQTAPDTVQITFLTSGSNPVSAETNLKGAGFHSLPDGRYNLFIDASKVTGPGGAMAGNFMLDSALSPSPPTNIFRFFGDVTGDGVVAASDFNGTGPTGTPPNVLGFRSVFGGSYDILDYNGDNAVAASDFSEFRQRFGGTVP